VVINTLHGDTNTIGGVQRFLEQHNIPYTGSSSETCSVISDRASIKEELSKFGINTPRHILYSAYLEDLDGGSYGDFAFDKARDVLNRLPPPWVVKPLTRESSMGIFVCKTVKELVNAFTVGAQEKVSILVEEMIEGKHANMSVINNFRDQDIYPLLCSGNFTPNEKRDVEELAKLVHEKLNLRHYSQSDLIVTPNRGIYVVEVNAFPELHKDATIHKHLEDIGSKTSDFIEHIIGLARS
jgi:D-alanine-D-alanine ligase-like ATP-grasp enzyme